MDADGKNYPERRVYLVIHVCGHGFVWLLALLKAQKFSLLDN